VSGEEAGIESRTVASFALALTSWLGLIHKLAETRIDLIRKLDYISSTLTSMKGSTNNRSDFWNGSILLVLKLMFYLHRFPG
jgi:hypothetical protein